MVLPDNAFFDLMRSALGNIKTPFNKQRLLDDLSAFLARPDIQETIAALLGEDDRRIVAAIALLGEPVPGEMERFFAGDFHGAGLHETLLCLEERLIIYRFREEGTARLALNPRLEAVLAPIAADPSPLFPSLTAPSAASPTAAGDTERDEAGPAVIHAGDCGGRTLAAVFAFFLSGERFFQNEKTGTDRGADYAGFTLRKKTLEEGKRLFPGIDLEILAGAFAALGLFTQDGEYLRAESARLAAFAFLEEEDRAAYLAAGMALYLRGAEGGENAAGLPPLFNRRVLVRNTARLVRALPDALRAFESARGAGDRLYPRTTLIKLAEILKREEKPAWDFSGEIPPVSLILTAMEKAGLLSGGPAAYRLPAPRQNAEAPSGPLIAFDSPFSFILYPEIPFAGALELALSCDLEETGTAPRFTLSRESVARGFDRGRDAAGLWELLDRLSGGRVEENLKYNIEDWERRYHEVALYEGVIVTLGGERAYLAERGPLARMVRRTILKAEEGRPGVYLLDASNRETAANALRSAGVDIFAEQEAFFSSPRSADGFFPRPAGKGAIPALPEITGAEAVQKEAQPVSRSAEDILEQFRAALGEMKLERQDKEALLERIGRRIIVSAEQLKASSFRYEKREARALDYGGKNIIARQAIASGSLLEITWTGSALPLTGTPEGLEKKGTEMILVFRPREGAPDPLRIPLGKISLMKRIQQSIFGE
jgi:hypothetical protein